MAGLNKDDDFYMTLVTLQVEDYLFRVPRHTLEAQSTVFQDMFSFPPPPSIEVEGSSNECPIRLDGVKADEFRQLLKVLFPGPCGPRQHLNSEEWISVLKLSQMWQCQQARAIALKELPYSSVRKGAVEKVALAFQYDIKQWLIPGLNEMARRPEPISAGDVHLLGLDVALKVAAVRESLVFQPANPSSPPQDLDSDDGILSDRHVRPVGRVISGTRNACDVDFTPTIKKIFELSGSEGFNNHPVLKDEKGGRTQPRKGRK
ncbi:hypothetical protein V8B97DRAFT_2057421 [Scleroderma yunnanense]